MAIAGRDRDRAEAAAAEIAAATGATVVGLAGDLTRPGTAETLVAEAVARLGGLRGMALTTGLGLRGQHDLLAGSDDWTATLDDVLLATVRACRAAVPVLAGVGGGAIVTTAAYSIRSPKAHQVALRRAEGRGGHADEEPGQGLRRRRGAGHLRLPGRHRDRDPGRDAAVNVDGGADF